MARTTAPLLSLGARGTIGKTLTFGSWKGVGYARQRVVPANPQTTQQSATRNVFRAGGQSWRLLPTSAVNAFEDFVRGRPLTARNAYIGLFTRLLRGQANLADWVTSPGSGGAPSPASVAVSAGAVAGQILVQWTAPEIPSGWSITAAHAVASLDHIPAENWTQAIVTAADTTEAGQILLAGLEAGQTYAVSVFLEWTRADARKAFSVSTTALQAAAA